MILMIEIVGDNMKVTLTNGIEIQCTPEEYEILCNKGLIPGVVSNNKTTITINENDPLDLIIKPKVKKEKPGLYHFDRYIDTTPTAGTEAVFMTP